MTASTNTPPQWISDALRNSVGELREFFVTSAGFLRRPGRFADEWYRGERHALNPAGCVATAGAIILPANSFLSQIWYASAGSPSSLAAQIVAAIGPYLYYVAIAAFAHPFFRAAGSTRPLSSSIGVVLYAGSLPGLGSALMANLGVSVLTARGETYGSQLSSFVVLLVLATFFVFIWASCAGLAGLHRVRWWRALLNLALAVVAAGIVIGQVKKQPVGTFGFHFAMQIWKAGKFIHPRPSFTL